LVKPCRDAEFPCKVDAEDQCMNWMDSDSEAPSSKQPATLSAAEIRAFFNQASSHEDDYPSTIDPRIYHVKLLVQHLGDLSKKCVADVGCGKGRFARIVRDRYPSAAVLSK
jgi:hypothetical protein